jgi:hypothetical protein
MVSSWYYRRCSSIILLQSHFISLRVSNACSLRRSRSTAQLDVGKPSGIQRGSRNDTKVYGRSPLKPTTNAGVKDRNSDRQKATSDPKQEAGYRVPVRIRSMRYSPERKAGRTQRGRKLQRPTFRYKHRLRQECICICHEDVGYQLRTTDGRSSDEREPEDMDDTPVGSLGVVEHLVGPVVRDGLAHPFVLTRNTGTTHRMHTRRTQTLQRVHSQCR